MNGDNMEYVLAAERDTERIFSLVQNTIKAVYTKYYPQKVVDFFCTLHSKENILSDIQKCRVGMLVDGDALLGTGSHEGGHITRVYVAPVYQGRGFGKYIMQELERVIRESCDSVMLEASLPAVRVYEKLGYRTECHDSFEKGTILVYDIMKKQLK